MPHADPDKRYPRWAYHPTLAKDGKLIKSEADEPTDEGWVDTPAAFAADYKAPEPVDHPEGLAGESRVTQKAHEHYPSWRYHVDGKPEPILVKDADADAALDAAVWKTSPDPKHWGSDASLFARPKPGPAAPPSAATVAQQKEDEAQRNELWAADGNAVIARVKALDSREMLERIRAFEALNPEGPRVGILKAVKATLDTLTEPVQ